MHTSCFRIDGNTLAVARNSDLRVPRSVSSKGNAPAALGHPSTRLDASIREARPICPPLLRMESPNSAITRNSPRHNNHSRIKNNRALVRLWLHLCVIYLAKACCRQNSSIKGINVDLAGFPAKVVHRYSLIVFSLDCKRF